MKPSNPFPMLQNESHSNLKFVCESERETDKAESFADDTSVLAVLSQDNLVNIKQTLLQFSCISGLKCNFEKSVIIPLNNMRNLGPIDNLDFKVANSFTLLGMEIDSNLEFLRKNFDKTNKKMENTVLYWNRFNPGLPSPSRPSWPFLPNFTALLGCFTAPFLTFLKVHFRS